MWKLLSAVWRLVHARALPRDGVVLWLGKIKKHHPVLPLGDFPFGCLLSLKSPLHEGRWQFSSCSEDCQQHLDLWPAQGPRYTCMNMLNQQCGKKMKQVPASTCCAPFPSHWSTSGRGFRGAGCSSGRQCCITHVESHSQFSLHKSRESITFKSDSQQETVFNCLYFTSGSFRFSCAIWNDVPVNALKSFWKGECAYQAS